MANKNAEYMDEQIIELIGQREKELELKDEIERIECEIQAGLVTIGDEKIEFEEKSLFDNRIRISIPKSFIIMPPEIASIKYPYEKKPDPIYTSETTTKNVSFNYMDSDVEEKEIGAFKDSMMAAMERIYPTASWLEDGVREVNGRKIGFFEFVSQALDANLYNLMFFAELDGKALIGAVNCIEDEMDNWIPVAKGIMSSVKIIDR